MSRLFGPCLCMCMHVRVCERERDRWEVLGELAAQAVPLSARNSLKEKHFTHQDYGHYF